MAVSYLTTMLRVQSRVIDARPLNQGSTAPQWSLRGRAGGAGGIQGFDPTGLCQAA